jgi:hypothetical protein
MATTAASTIPLAVAARGQRFYVGMAATCLAVGVIGFAPTYWVPMLRRTLDVPPLTHLHALFFYGWLVLFLRQTALAASGRLTRHRELGVAGVALATGMCFVGLGMAIGSLKRLEAAGAGDPARAFSIVSFSAIALFAALFAAAIINVKKPDVHKRLMLVATVSMLQAAVGRWFLLFLAPRTAGLSGPPAVPPVLVSVVPGMVIDLLIVAAMIHDRRTRGRVHPVYWYAGAVVLAVQVLRVPISATSAWMNVTHWLVALLQ